MIPNDTTKQTSSIQCLTSTRNHQGIPTSTNSIPILLSTSPMKIQSSNGQTTSTNDQDSFTSSSSSSSPLQPTTTSASTSTSNLSPIIEMTDPDESIFILTESQSDTFASLLAGLGSGTLSSIACAPLDLIRTRMQVVGDLKTNTNTNVNSSSSGSSVNVKTTTNNTSKLVNGNIIQGIKDIIATDGVRGCFRGLGPTLMTVPTFWGLYFPSYEFLKKDLYRRGIGRERDRDNNGQDVNPFEEEFNEKNGGRVPPIVHMSAAIMAGAWADFFCNPMFVVRTRMQTEALHYMELPIQERKPMSISQTVKGLYHEGGIPIFWRGFSASLLGLSHVAIQFPAYEFFKAEARERSMNNQESALDLLFASGISKMIATSLTYPHEVVRSRMMDQRGKEGQVQGLVKTFMRIVKKEGVGALYTGIHVSLVRVVPNCCITFMTYELILRWVKGNL